jgi:transposase-like protein
MGRNQNRATEATWRDRVARYGKSGLTITAFCRQEGVSQPSFYQWRNRLKKEGQSGKPDRQRSEWQRKTVKPFVPVSVSAALVSEVAEVEFPNGIRIRVPAANLEALRVAIETAGAAWREVR